MIHSDPLALSTPMWNRNGRASPSDGTDLKRRSPLNVGMCGCVDKVTPIQLRFISYFKQDVNLLLNPFLPLISPFPPSFLPLFPPPFLSLPSPPDEPCCVSTKHSCCPPFPHQPPAVCEPLGRLAPTPCASHWTQTGGLACHKGSLLCLGA
jgi:hypothetical protein